jgi:hypothetical protein
MANRVNVNITARDLTRGQLAGIRRNFNQLGNDLDRAVTARTRENFSRLSQSANQARRDLHAMRGAIPDDEFYRLDDAIQRAQRRLQRGFSNVGDRAFRRIQDDLQRVRDGFNDLDQNGQIRVRVDLSALRRADAQLAAWRRTQSARRITPRVDPDVDSRFGTRLTRVLTAPFRRTGSVLGGILSDGIGQGIVQGFQGGGAAGKAIFAVILAGIISWLAAALGGLLITTLGAAFVTVGGIAAFQSEQIQKKWKTVLGSLKKDFEEVGKPMIPVLDRALTKLQQMSNRVAPQFAKALDSATPATNKFIDKIFEGFQRLGKQAFKPIMDAWEVFAPIFGEVFSDFLNDVGKHLGTMADLVRDHSYEIETALRMLFGILSGLVKAVTWLMEAWIWAMGAMGDATGALMKYGINPLVKVALFAFGQMIEGADRLLGALGFGDKLDKAKADFKAWSEGVISDLDAGAEAAFGFDEAMERLNRTRKLKADISSWRQDLATAKKKLKDVIGTKAEAKVRANIRDLERKIAKAERLIKSMNGRTATSYVYTVYQDRYTSLDQRQRRHGLRTGGVVGSAATGGVRNHQTLVGEDGPEIVDLPAGSRVRSNPDTRRLMGGSGGGSEPVRLMIDAGPSETSRLLLKLLRNAIRVEGGNVELVLGRNS